ncbi:hypothetical protein V513_02455 [Mesotoga sp. H07.pep.5.3]|nr:hypothetical protein V513_02455 [Mesotoga sp. H07.pep.5.3]
MKQTFKQTFRDSIIYIRSPSGTDSIIYIRVMLFFIQLELVCCSRFSDKNDEAGAKLSEKG